MITALGLGLNETILCLSSARARGKMSLNYLPNKEIQLALKGNNKGCFFLSKDKIKSLNLGQIIPAPQALKVQSLVRKEMLRLLNSAETLSPM